MKKIFLILMILIIGILPIHSQTCPSLIDVSGGAPLPLNFTVTPKLVNGSPSLTHTFYVRNNYNAAAWSLRATRIGLDPGTQNVASDHITYSIMVTPIMTTSIPTIQGAFGTGTSLSNITNNTRLVSFNRRTGTNCMSNNASYFQVSATITVPEDFYYNNNTQVGTIQYTVTNF